ncbi:hypothetical protein BDN70DRAFT_871670, partial [Pholiota conissans]
MSTLLIIWTTAFSAEFFYRPLGRSSVAVQASRPSGPPFLHSPTHRLTAFCSSTFTCPASSSPPCTSVLANGAAHVHANLSRLASVVRLSHSRGLGIACSVSALRIP